MNSAKKKPMLNHSDTTKQQRQNIDNKIKKPWIKNLEIIDVKIKKKTP